MKLAASIRLLVQFGIVLILWISGARVASMDISAWALASCRLAYFTLTV